MNLFSGIEEIAYNKEQSSFTIAVDTKKAIAYAEKATSFNEWLYSKNDGFFLKESIKDSYTIEGADAICTFLETYTPLVKAYTKESFFEHIRQPRYELAFDSAACLHIDTYFFNPKRNCTKK